MKSVMDYIHAHSSTNQEEPTKSPDFHCNNKPQQSESNSDAQNFKCKEATKACQKDVQCQVNLCDAPALWEIDNFEGGDNNCLLELGKSESGHMSLVQLTELLHNNGQRNALKQMNDKEIVTLLKNRIIQPQKLESLLGDEAKAVHIRRVWLSSVASVSSSALNNLPYKSYDYSMVSNQCCENVIGYIPLPVGYAGPLIVNSKSYYIPMATTEGCLIASTNRGCRAIGTGSGVTSMVYADAMTRGPCLQFDNVAKACEFLAWTQKESHFSIIKQTFELTSRYAKLQYVKCRPAGSLIFMRLGASTGDAMGMNMVTKGTESVLQMLRTRYFPDMRIVSLSGNYCVDKKPAALNWIEGRGKSVVSEATIPATTVSEILKTDVASLVELSKDKNLIGSAMAGALGGFNAHSANVVTAVFLATGQDPAQNMSSSNCVTLLSHDVDTGGLRISCTMPSLEVGTIGGGTILPPQMAALQMLGCAGGNVSQPGANAKRLAEIICAAVLAGELSLLAALSSGHLVKSHLKHNRSSVNLREASSSNLSALDGAIKLVDKSMKSTGFDPSSCSKIL